MLRILVTEYSTINKQKHAFNDSWSKEKDPSDPRSTYFIDSLIRVNVIVIDGEKKKKKTHTHE